ncbi:MAG: TadE/TadG family type IV pilus assembly protein [Pirellulaceae bacterium]
MSRRTSEAQRRGATVVEFALTAPILFMLLFGALELGHANMILNVSEAAAYEGAREGIVPGASAAEVRAAAQRILGISNIRGAAIQVNPANLALETDTIRVDITVPYAQNTLMPPFFTGGLIIQRSCELAREDPS